jgi:hypothetical protein
MPRGAALRPAPTINGCSVLSKASVSAEMRRDNRKEDQPTLALASVIETRKRHGIHCE